MTTKKILAVGLAAVLGGALVAGCSSGGAGGVSATSAGSTSVSSTSIATTTATTTTPAPTPSSPSAPSVTVTDATQKAYPNAGTAGPWAVQAAQAMAMNEKVMQCASLQFSKLSIKDFQYLFPYMDNYAKAYTETAWKAMESFNKTDKADLDHLTRLRSLTMFCADFEGYTLRTPAVSLPQVQGKVTVDVDPANRTYQGATLLKVSMTTKQQINVTRDSDETAMVFPFHRKVTFWLVPDAAGSSWLIHQYGGSYEMGTAVPDPTRP